MAQRGECPTIENKIHVITSELWRSKQAMNRKEVKYYYFFDTLKSMWAILGGLGFPLIGGISTFNPDNPSTPTNPDLFTWLSDLPTPVYVVIVLIFLVGVASYAYYQKRGMEKIAVNALAVSDGATFIEKDLGPVLMDSDPMIQLDLVQKRLIDLTALYYNAILPRNKDNNNQIALEASQWIDQYCSFWTVKEPEAEQQETRISVNLLGGL